MLRADIYYFADIAIFTNPRLDRRGFAIFTKLKKCRVAGNASAATDAFFFINFQITPFDHGFLPKIYYIEILSRILYTDGRGSKIFYP